MYLKNTKNISLYVCNITGLCRKIATLSVSLAAFLTLLRWCRDGFGIPPTKMEEDKDTEGKQLADYAGEADDWVKVAWPLSCGCVLVFMITLTLGRLGAAG